MKKSNTYIDLFNLNLCKGNVLKALKDVDTNIKKDDILTLKSLSRSNNNAFVYQFNEIDNSFDIEFISKNFVLYIP